MKQPQANKSRSYGWCFTLNNYTVEELINLDNIECQYIICGKEVGESGTQHIQGYIHYKTNVRFAQVKKALGPRAHIEPRMGTLIQAIEYCKKDGDFSERGTIRTGKENKWADMTELAEQGKLEEIKEEYPQFYFLYKQKIESMVKRTFDPINDDLHNHFEWWVGPTGTGKSRTAWDLFGNNRYLKGIHKWWDGYQYEDVVIIEEADPKRCEHMAHYFKTWFDHYPFRAEVKCSMLNNIRPTKIIVTSNYTIRECFPNQQDYEPLERRFKVVHFPQKPTLKRQRAEEEQPPREPSHQPAFAPGWNAPTEVDLLALQPSDDFGSTEPFEIDTNLLGSLLEEL